MLLYDDSVTQREPLASTLTDILGGKERVEDMRLCIYRDTGSTITDTDYHPATLTPGGNLDKPHIPAITYPIGDRMCSIDDNIEYNLVDRSGYAEYLWYRGGRD